MKCLVISKKYDNKKLNKFLLDTFPGLTLNIVYKTLRKKDIKVNGKRINDNIVLHENDEIQIFIPDNVLYFNNNITLDVVFEDDNILVVNKPSGIEVTGIGSLTEFIQLIKKTDSIFPCHRLDRNTMGLVLFAKSKIALDILLQKFKYREIEKHYACMVYGIPQKREATLTHFLFKDNKKSLVYISDTFKKGYTKIITSYKVIDTNKSNNTSLLDVDLETGKTHQIRAHLAHIGHPIIGDGKYGINEINKKFKAKTQLLCSYKLIFKFSTDSDILNYLNGKVIKMNYSSYIPF